MRSISQSSRTSRMKFVSWKATPSAATVSRSASGAPSSGAMMRPTAAALPFM